MDLTVNEKKTLKNTALAATLGASAATICNYTTQNHILKNPDAAIDAFTKHIADLSSREANGTFAKELLASKIKGAQDALVAAQELIKSGKINNKMLAHAAVVGAAVTGCGYIVYKGVKAIVKPLLEKKQ
ncbi:MAG: hypothetical protein K6A44_03840 [bacterium]|nr:hypothetical protein [bacterium]